MSFVTLVTEGNGAKTSVNRIPHQSDQSHGRSMANDVITEFLGQLRVVVAGM